jgi:hypothetical protein
VSGERGVHHVLAWCKALVSAWPTLSDVTGWLQRSVDGSETATEYNDPPHNHHHQNIHHLVRQSVGGRQRGAAQGRCPQRPRPHVVFSYRAGNETRNEAEMRLERLVFGRALETSLLTV